MQGFGRSLRMVTAAHVGVLLGLSIISGCRALFERKPPTTIPIEFTVEVPADPGIDALPDVSPAPVQAPPEPPPPVIAPPPPAEAARPVAPRPPIETSRRRVTRQGAAPVRKPRLTPEEIERLLAQGARPSDHTRIPDADARGFARVRAAFYEVWVQPSRAEVGDLSAEAVIVLATGGRVVSGRLSRPSGNVVLDNSVRRALNALQQVTGLPAGFEDRHREITVAFRLE